MSPQWDSQTLVLPITAGSPCGESLEESPLLTAFDTFRLFGQAAPLDPSPTGGRSRTRRSRLWQEAGICAFSRTWGPRVLQDRGLCGVLRHAGHRREVVGNVLDRGASAGDRRRHRAPERAELLCRSDGGHRRPAAHSARQQPRAWHVQPAGHRDRHGADPPEGRGGAARRGTDQGGVCRHGRRGAGRLVTTASSGPRPRSRASTARMRDAAGSDATPDFDALSAQLVENRTDAERADRPASRGSRRDRAGRRRRDGGRRRGRRHQVETRRHPGAGRRGGLLSAHRAVEPDSDVPRARETSRLQGFSRSAGRRRAGRGPAGASGRRVDGRASSGRVNSAGGVPWRSRAVRNSSPAIARRACRSSTTWSCTAPRRRSSCRS